MDGKRFDQWTRIVAGEAGQQSRRGLLRLALAALLSEAAPILAPQETLAACVRIRSAEGTGSGVVGAARRRHCRRRPRCRGENICCLTGGAKVCCRPDEPCCPENLGGGCCPAARPVCCPPGHECECCEEKCCKHACCAASDVCCNFIRPTTCCPQG